MALLSEAMKEKETDSRMLNRSVAKGLLLKADADKKIGTVQDDADNAITTNIEDLMNEVKNKKSGLR